MNYAPLYIKTENSLLESTIKVTDLINEAKKNNIKCLTITDGLMFGVMEFYRACISNDIKPIIGMEAIYNDKCVVLYAKNYKGYQSLIKLSTIMSRESLKIDDFYKYSEDVICILPFSSRNLYDEFNKIYEDIYLSYSNIEEYTILNSNKSLYMEEVRSLNSSDTSNLEYLEAIKKGILKKEVTTNYSKFYLKTLDEYQELDYTQENNINFVNKINIEIPKRDNLLPIYDTKGIEVEKYLRNLCKEGLKKRFGESVPKIYIERLKYELSVIEKMGFCNYFLVVQDYVKFAKENGILVGPGRGSAAGSLVSYVLNITDIDPIRYNLLFERFLNPERITMPDIDIDFLDSRRDEVINYCIEKYGIKNACGIITFGTLASKQAIRDVFRTLDIDSDIISKMLSSRLTLLENLNQNSKLKNYLNEHKEVKDAYMVAMKLEGLKRHTSIHAAGMVISSTSLDEVVPLIYHDSMYLTAYSMNYLEDLGLLKMDFLGLKNLTIIDNIIKDIKEQTGEVIEFTQIPLDDKETLNIFETANTSGIFQFESVGMRNFLRRLKPNTFEDIFAAIALFRPGPAVNIDTYIKRKHGEEKVEYLDESLKDILSNTYGILIYQEQIMQLASIYAGYSLGEADILRRAMSKKKLELLKNEEEKFITKSVQKGHDATQAKQIFDLVLNFAGYGFNRSHSVAYSLIAYKMAYLKTHYKTIFFANLLTNVIGSESKTHEYIMEAKANRIDVVKPTINESEERYIVKDNKIIYPISNIKSVGAVVSRTIKTAKEEGKFLNIYDCFSRLYIAGIGKKTLEVLIYADVFKEFGYNRATLIYNLDSLFNYAELTKDIDPSLVMKPEIEEQVEYQNVFLLEKEKEVFGFYLSSHPTTMYKKDNPYCITLNNISQYFSKKVDTLILVDKIKVIDTKKGDKMAFITGSDETGTMDYTLFPRTYKEYSNIQKGDLLKVRGNVERRLDQYQIIIEKIKNLQEEAKNEE